MSDLDLIQLATPGFFAAMGLEKVVLDRQSAEGKTDAIGFETRDSIASLVMGTASLYMPLALNALLAPVMPGKGKHRKVLLGTAVGAAAFCCFICSAASAATGRTSSATTVVLLLGVQLPWSMRTVLGSLAAVRS